MLTPVTLLCYLTKDRSEHCAQPYHTHCKPPLKCWALKMLSWTWALKMLSWTLLGSLGFLSIAKSLQSCPTLCDPIDGSPPGSAVPGILQARTSTSPVLLAWRPVLSASQPMSVDWFHRAQASGPKFGLVTGEIVNWTPYPFSLLTWN